jgi:hypothetical protein
VRRDSGRGKTSTDNALSGFDTTAADQDTLNALRRREVNWAAMGEALGIS